MATDRRRTVVRDFADDRRATPDRRRQDPDSVGRRLAINLNSDLDEIGGGKKNGSPFPDTNVPLVDITPYVGISILALLIWGLLHSCG